MQKPLTAKEISRKSLNHFLQTVHVRLATAESMEHSAPWFSSAGEGMASFYVVLKGACRIYLDGGDESDLFHEGDIAVLLPGSRHSLQSGRKQTGYSRILRGRFTWSNIKVALQLPEFPPLIRLNYQNCGLASWVRVSTPVMVEDWPLTHPGVRTMLNQVAYAVFVQSILSVLPPLSCAD
jgi:hypothetical protein